MPLSIAEIMPIVAMQKLAPLGPNYVLSTPRYEDHRWHCVLTYLPLHYNVSFSWAPENEVWIPSEGDRIAFCRELLDDAVRQLDNVILRQRRQLHMDLPLVNTTHNDEVLDVDFS
jgi:hypothetical protein